MILHAFLFKSARVMDHHQNLLFLQCRSDAEVVSVYTQKWDGELSGQKSLGFSIYLICKRCLKTRGTVEKYQM